MVEHQLRKLLEVSVHRKTQRFANWRPVQSVVAPTPDLVTASRPGPNRRSFGRTCSRLPLRSAQRPRRNVRLRIYVLPDQERIESSAFRRIQM